MRFIMFPVASSWLLSRRIRLALLAWIGLEIVTFVLVVRWIGPGGAVLAGLATSLLGFSQLRRAGRAAVATLRAGLGARPVGAPGVRVPGAGPPLVDETLGTLGGLCLLLPGFLSDLVGLALAVPALRHWLSRRVGRWVVRAPGAGGSATHPPGTIDLDPGEWRHTEKGRDGAKPILPP